jgi:polyhydroxyalkanoate synthesis regulator phasin
VVAKREVVTDTAAVDELQRHVDDLQAQLRAARFGE